MDVEWAFVDVEWAGVSCSGLIAGRRGDRDAGGIEPFHDTPTDGPRPDRGSTLRSAAVYVLSVFAFAIAFLVVGSLLYDPVPLWVLIVFPLLVFAGAVGSLWWTFRTWQAERSAAVTPRGRWQVWQGASWFLLAMFLLSLGGTGGALMDR